MWGNWSTYPVAGDDPIMGPIPQAWWGTVDRDGDESPWLEAPCGSTYLYMNGATPILYIKDAAAAGGHDNDWGTIATTNPDP